jgi:hypothetical protein
MKEGREKDSAREGKTRGRAAPREVEETEVGGEGEGR